MQFFSFVLLALAGTAIALPNASPADEGATLEKRCAGVYGYCRTTNDCCSGLACYTKGGYCVR